VAFNPLQPKPGTALVGIAARKAAAEAARAAQLALSGTQEVKPVITVSNALDCTDRIGIVFDDSGSMGGNKILNAHKGVEEFLRNCKPNQTAVCVYPMNMPPITLDAKLPSVALAVHEIAATGRTPLHNTALSMLRNEKLTRAIVFSDGNPTDDGFETLVTLAKEQKIPIDTVLIGNWGMEYMKNLAEATGGIFLHFDPAKTNFATNFKYLTPGYRAMLRDSNFKAKVEGK